MAGVAQLLAEFDAQDLPEDLARQFKVLALLLKDLPEPRNLQAVRNLLVARGIAVRAR